MAMIKAMTVKAAMVAKPSGANMLIRAYCESNGIVFIDVFRRMTRGRSNILRGELTSDGLHLNAEGYKIWAFELRRHIKRLEKTR